MIKDVPQGQVSDENGPTRPAWLAWFKNTQNAVNSVYESGPSANRPTKGLWLGRRYWDTDTGEMVSWNGVSWVAPAGGGGGGGYPEQLGYASL
jgi:hypothetical protein